MYKHILTTALLVIFNIHSTFAHFYDERLNLSDVFIKGSIGGNIFHDLKADGDTMKSKFSPSVALGIGVHTSDNFRTDLTYEYYIDPTFTHSSNNDGVFATTETKMQLDLSTLMANFSFDVIELSRNRIFLQAGLGVAKHKTKYSAKGVYANGTSIEINSSTKTAHNFTYALGCGVVFPLTYSANIEVAYTWKDLGSIRPKQNDDGEEMIKKFHYRSHNLSLGFRFDL